ncbi:MAG: AbrB/MazE/SpoVT family DNA-binding domain-containing protein [Candidatus Hydrothermarchaeaceae archaeon]
MKTKLEDADIKCFCGEWAKPIKKMNLEGYAVRGWECPSCKEKFINPADANYVLTIKKLEKERLEGKITKTGNSYALRLPKKLVDSLGYKIGDTIEIKLKAPRKIELSSD